MRKRNGTAASKTTPARNVSRRKVKKNTNAVNQNGGAESGKVDRKLSSDSSSGEDIVESGRETESDVSTEGQGDDVHATQSKSKSDQSKWKQAGKKAKGTDKAEYVCKGGGNKCDKVIKSTDACIQCEACAGWFHPTCQGLVRGAFEAISEHDIFWVCGKCKDEFLEQRKMKKQTEQNFKKMEATIVSKVEEVKKLMVKEIDRRVDDGLKKVEMKIGESSTVLKKVVQEKSIDRTKNVIIHNLPE